MVERLAQGKPVVEGQDPTPAVGAARARLLAKTVWVLVEKSQRQIGHHYNLSLLTKV